MPIYEIAKGGKLNAYKLFLALSNTLANPENGILCEIFQNSFLADSSAKMLRKHFLTEFQISKIDSFPERDDIHKRVFESVKMSVCILLGKRSKSQETNFTLNIWRDRNRLNGEQIQLSPNIIFSIDPETASIPSISTRT